MFHKKEHHTFTTRLLTNKQKWSHMTDRENIKPLLKCSFGIDLYFFQVLGKIILLMQSHQVLCENVVIYSFIYLFTYSFI